MFNMKHRVVKTIFMFKKIPFGIYIEIAQIFKEYVSWSLPLSQKLQNRIILLTCLCQNEWFIIYAYCMRMVIYSLIELNQIISVDECIFTV